MPGAGTQMPGFGASDCGCQSHLFWFEEWPEPTIAGIEKPPYCDDPVARQGEMRSAGVIVAKIRGEDAMQVDLVEHDHVVQAIAAYGAYDPFAVNGRL